MAIGIWDKLSEHDANRVKRIVDMLGNKEEIKIDNAPGAYMPLVVDYLYTIKDFKGWKNLKVISFAHFSVQNGDAMRDPEVNFLYNDEGLYPLVVPFYFRNDYTGTETEAMDISAGTINNKKQKEITSFFRGWLDNIYQQQDLAGMAAAKAFAPKYHFSKRIKSNGTLTGDVNFVYDGDKYTLAHSEDMGTGVNSFYGMSKEEEDTITFFHRKDSESKERTAIYEEIKPALAEWLKESNAQAQPIEAEPIIDKPMDQTEEKPDFSANESQLENREEAEGSTAIAVEEKLSEAAEELAESPNPVSWFVGDNFYASHPENILGVPYEASGRFGKVIKYKGGIEDIDRIEAETDFLKPFNFDTNPLISTEKLTVQEMIVSPAAQENAKKAIAKSRKTISKKIAAKSILIPSREAEMQTISEIYNKYNPEITDDELFAFIWYRDSIGRRLSQHWYEVAFERGGNIDDMYSEETLKRWVESGVLYYYSKNDVKSGGLHLVPSYLYLAENVWHKQAHLEVDKEHIIATYGQAVYEQQLTNMKAVFKVKYDNRITLKEAGSANGLVLLPISDFAKKFMIKTFEDEQPFVLKMVDATTSKNYGKPDFFHSDFLKKEQWGRSKATEVEELSLTDAFCTWMVMDKTIQYKKGTSYAEIIQYYINKKPIRYESDEDDVAGRKRELAEHERRKARAKEIGDQLFLHFLHTKLTLADTVRLETQWNSTFNGYVPINFNKVPVLFSCAKEFRKQALDIRPEKREAAAFIFSEGSGCLAYGTGIGKTFSSIFTIAQFMYAGYCRRPLIVVPNSVYKQFMGEVKGLLPQFDILGLYNLGKDYMAQLRDEDGKIKEIPDMTISIMTYEGFENIGFNDQTATELIGELYEILNQGIDEVAEKQSKTKKDEKKLAAFQQKLESLIGRGLRNTMINIEDLGFDYITYDEAHKMKKVFTTVKGEQKVEQTTGKKSGTEASRYDINSGTPSAIALKGFMISYYVQSKNYWGNICLLTATPFTNSALEIFSMLSFIAYRKLLDTEMNSLTKFFDNFIDVSYELVINAHLQPQRKQVIKGFNNLVAMQQLIRRFINYKSEEDVDAKKPNKIVLPLLHKRIGDTVMTLTAEERVETSLPMTPQQERMMSDIKEYVDGTKSLSSLAGAFTEDDDVEIDTSGEEANEGNSTQGVTLDYDSLDKNEKMGVRILRAMSFSRNLAISPYLYEHSGLGRPTYNQYIETSPKLNYTMQCIKSVKDWHEQNNTPISGQIIYMDRGLSYFCLIKEYLVKEMGYLPHEVEMVCSGMPKEGYRSKTAIQNRFLGIRFNEETLEFEDIPDADRIKILIGSSSIREGMNLQKHSTVLYNCCVDWNPADEIQLEGRIHRQGNLFNVVRICIPLMMDSMDIFMFQKLEEKTARINTIWSTNGKQNVLKIEDFNPRELKNILIKDPRVLAQINIEEDTEKMEDEVNNLRADIWRIEEIGLSYKVLEDEMEDMVEFIEPFRDLKKFEKDTPIWEKAKYIAQKINEFVKKPTNKAGERLFTESQWKHEYSDIMKMERNGEKVSRTHQLDYRQSTKPWAYDKFTLAARELAKENEAFIIPHKIKITKLESYKKRLEQDIEGMKAEIGKIRDKENLERVTQRIIAERIANKYEVRSVGEVANDFKKLNYMLGDKKPVAPVAPPVPPKPTDGGHGYRSTMRELIALLKEEKN